MADGLTHIGCFKEREVVKTQDGKNVRLFEFNCDGLDNDGFSKWAKHFRNHYCLDDEIDILRKGTGLSRKEYLENLKFPDMQGFGPGIRAGDFGEILVSDYLEFVLEHWVPRTRYGNKTITNESSKGSDLIGFKLFDKNESPKDILTMFEAKTQFSGQDIKPRLQNAIDDSGKDLVRKAESLNAIKQRLFDKGRLDEMLVVERFQNPEDKPYKEQFGAAALYCTSIFDKSIISTTSAKDHPNRTDLILIVITSNDFMKLVNKLFSIAANEA